jgi:hypothetical protein
LGGTVSDPDRQGSASKLTFGTGSACEMRVCNPLLKKNFQNAKEMEIFVIKYSENYRITSFHFHKTANKNVRK